MIDQYFLGVPNVQVTIAGATGTTGPGGDFGFTGVPATYDAIVHVVSGSNRSVWRYEGLSRRDPTLQVEDAGPVQSGSVSLSFSSVDFASRAEGDQVLLSFGSPNGLKPSQWEVQSASYSDTIDWRGPSSARVTAHALRLLKLDGRIEASDFYSYSEAAMNLSDSGSASASLDLPATSYLSSGALSGAVQLPAGSMAQVQLWLRWPDYATMQLVDDSTVTGAFSYSIPTTPGGTFTLMAVAITDDYVRIVHVDGLTARSDYQMLPLPLESTLIAPADRAQVDAQTTFQWSGNAKLYVLRAWDDQASHQLQVVTTNRQARLPIIPGAALSSGREYGWWVETHGDYASVDQATGPKGFLDTCATRNPIGPERGVGTYTESKWRSFTPP